MGYRLLLLSGPAARRHWLVSYRPSSEGETGPPDVLHVPADIYMCFWLTSCVQSWSK